MTVHTKNHILVYISAASDLAGERELLGRALTEVPVSLGWHIVQSPGGDQPVDLQAVTGADLHLLLLGSDIRAPIGQEWIAARRAGLSPLPLLKQGILRTSAGESFRRFIAGQAAWRPFKDGGELRTLALKLVAGHILARAVTYGLSPSELAGLQVWRSELDEGTAPSEQDTLGGAGESGVVLSPERYLPSDGILLGEGSPHTNEVKPDDRSQAGVQEAEKVSRRGD